MDTEQNVRGRDLVVKEITDTVRYLMRKNSEGAESIGLEELLDKKLEQNIILNFEGQISIPEYEQIVTRMFQEDAGESTKNKSEEMRRLIEDETESLMRRQRIRDVDDLKMRIFRKLKVSSETEDMAKKAILNRYSQVAQKIIFDVIGNWMDNGVTDDSKLLRAIKLERFALDPKRFTELLTAGKRWYRNKTDGGGDPAGGMAGKREQRQAAPEEPGESEEASRQKRDKLVREKIQKKKERFIEKFVRPIRFQLIENRDIDGYRHLGYRGIIMGKDMQIRAVSKNNKVEEMKIVFNRLMRGQKRILELDVIELKFLREGPQGMRGFIRKLQEVLDFWGQPSLQELLWFIMYGLTDKNGIHSSVVSFLRQNVLDFFTELDETLDLYALNKLSGAKD